MHRNTAIFIALLAVVAALLFGINVGKRLDSTTPISPSPNPLESPTPLTSPDFLPSPSPVVVTKFYSLADCGLSFVYDSSFTLTEASQAAILTNQNAAEQINVVCTDEIPRPPLTPERIEIATVAGIRTTLYHDASAKDGTPIDVVLFRHPETGLDTGLFGFGEAFNNLLKTVRLL